MSRLLKLLAVVLAITLVAASCGDDGDDAPEPAAPAESPARAGVPPAIALILASGLALGVGVRRARA